MNFSCFFKNLKQCLTPFQNVKFNIFIFALLAIASVLGTLIPQMPEAPEKVQEFIHQHPKLSELFQRLDFFNIYYSWWFVGLLGLLAFDVIVCKLIFGKFPGFKTFKDKERNLSYLTSLPFQYSWNSKTEPETIAATLSHLLKTKGFHLQQFSDEQTGEVCILAAKNRIQRFGSWISHVSILIILLANLTGALYGFREVLEIVEGNSLAMQNRPWRVHCDRFMVDHYEGTTTPKTFASDLRLFEEGTLVRQERILVNKPLEHKKVRFYQASYGPYLKEAKIGFFLRKIKDPKKSPVVTLRLDEEVPVPGTPYSLRILQFLPDFSMDETRTIATRSALPNNPALQILVSKNGKPHKAPWIFEKFPTLQMPPVQRDDDYILILADYVPAFSTGIQVTYDPGADLFWIGCTILVLGLMILFYLHHRKIWVFISKKEAGSKILFAGFSSRGKSFETEFLELANECKLQA